MYRLEFYEDEQGREPVLDWLRRLTPRKRRAIGVAMFEILQHEGPEVVGTNFGKVLGHGLFELRLDQDAAQVLARKGKVAKAERADEQKILLRVFCYAHGNGGSRIDDIGFIPYAGQGDEGDGNDLRGLHGGAEARGQG